MGVRSDLTLMRTAVNRGYPVTDSMRAMMIKTIEEIQNSPQSSIRDKLAANRLLIAADMANERMNQSEVSNEMILLIADQHGVKDEVLRIAASGESQASSVDAD